MTLWSRLFAIATIAGVALGIFAAEPQRAPRTAMKGYELYSWQRADGTWSFALLPGTNRLKQQKETNAAGADLRALKKRLSALARDEQVYWMTQSEGSTLPDPALVAYLRDYCAKLQIELHTPK